MNHPQEFTIALDDNEKLNLKAKNKGGVAEETVDSHEVGSILEDTNVNFFPDNDDNAQNEIQEYDSKPHSAPRLSFSFSRPYSRFSIARPKPPLKTALKLSFLKKASTVENVPEMFNRLPKISDHYTSQITVNAHSEAKVTENSGRSNNR